MTVKELSDWYPQLKLPISEGISKTEQYRNTVLRGTKISGEPDFIGTSEISYSVEHTPVGDIGIWCLDNRQDFEHALRALAYRCEPKEIPPSVGANFISGLINWEKIRAHKAAYLNGGGTDWLDEWKRFTSDKQNYMDKLILLSTGYYSGLSPETVGLSAEEWKEKSVIIRRRHELTHFLYRSMYPGDVETIRDEVLADYCGLMEAFGRYDADLAKKCLGIGGFPLKAEARIRHYVPEKLLSAGIRQAEFWITQFSRL